MKYYVIVLAVGNALEVTFSYGIELTRAQDSTWTTDTHACRFFMFTYFLGPSLANMALEALAIHVLLVGITGNQGENKRHVTVIGLFVLLSLILPLTRVSGTLSGCQRHCLLTPSLPFAMHQQVLKMADKILKNN